MLPTLESILGVAPGLLNTAIVTSLPRTVCAVFIERMRVASIVTMTLEGRIMSTAIANGCAIEYSHNTIPLSRLPVGAWYSTSGALLVRVSAPSL